MFDIKKRWSPGHPADFSGRTACKTAVLSCLTLCLAFLLTVQAAAGDTVYNWYCVHARNHAQPRADSTFDFIASLGGYYIDRRPGHTKPDDPDKVVYLTFDAGYENGNVAKILDTLKAEGATGAFFILGNLVTSEPDLVRRMADEGHLVCNHSYAHKNMTGWSTESIAQELTRLDDACRTVAGVEPAKYFRPPEGKFDAGMLKAVQALGYKTVFWSFAYADWDNGRQPDPAAAKKKILDNIHNGAVILLHPTSATNAAVLGDVLRELKAQGYRFGTLDELTAGTQSPETVCETGTQTTKTTKTTKRTRRKGMYGESNP